jgi:hypothetical protein
MLSTVVMAAAAAAVLALGTQDAHLLRLGVVAALWAALFAAFTTARARREISSRAEHADQLRAAYQLELQREVVARREHALTVERALREQAQLSQQHEIGQLRAELAAIGGNLARLAATATATTSTLAITSATPPSTMPSPTSGGSLPGPEFRLGPGRPATPSSYGLSRHGAPPRERSGSNDNDSPHRGSPQQRRASTTDGAGPAGRPWASFDPPAQADSQGRHRSVSLT